MAENFDLIFGQNASQQYAWSDNDYQNGWETIGNIPPTAAQFDALQRRADTKAQELNNNLAPLVAQNTANNRQPLTTYALKDIRYSSLLPTGWFLECAVDGTTASGEITVPSPLVENATITDGTVTWTIRKIGSGGGEAVGIIKEFAGNGDIPAGYLLCDGSAFSRAMFPDLFAAIGTTYGAGDGSTTFNVPDYNTAERFCQGSTVAGVVKQAGLPNINGEAAGAFECTPKTKQNEAPWVDGSVLSTNISWSGNSNVSSDLKYAKFDASQSNPIYGNSDTVQPNALTCRYIIKAFDGQTADSALIDITQYAQELANKADRSLSNLNAAGEARLANIIKMPNYDAEIDITNTTNGFVYTAPSDGYLKVSRSTSNGSYAAYLYKGENSSGSPIGSSLSGLSSILGMVGANSTTAADGVAVMMFPVQKDEKYFFNTNSITAYKLSFIPAKS